MITMTPTVAAIHGTRMFEGPVVVATVALTPFRAWKQRPAVITLGGYDIDNSTGVSAPECRHR